ncbi:MAG: hypothetical protein AAF705_11540 [Bacteroidota bacterium]
MKEVLDAPEYNEPPIFTSKSLKFFLFGLLCCAGILIARTLFLTYLSEKQTVITILGLCLSALVSFYTSMYHGYIGFRKKEPKVAQRVVVLTLSAILSSILQMVLIADFMEFVRYFQEF